MLSTLDHSVARNNLKGSWFVQCLCRVFMRHSCREDLDTLLLRVTQELRAYCTTKGEKQVACFVISYFLHTHCAICCDM